MRMICGWYNHSPMGRLSYQLIKWYTAVAGIVLREDQPEVPDVTKLRCDQKVCVCACVALFTVPVL